MKVVLINTSDGAGGAQGISTVLMRGLRSRGHAVELAVGHGVREEPGVTVLPNAQRRHPLARMAAHAGGILEHHRGKPRLGRAVVRAGEPLRTARVLRGDEDFDFPGTSTLLEQHPRPDAIHAHNLHGGYFDLRVLPALSRLAPLVVTMHDSWLLTGHCAHSFACERWRVGCGSCPHLDTYPAVPRDRTAANWLRKRDIYARSELHVAAPSRWLAARAADSILAAGAREIRVIPNGVDLSTFAPGDRALARRQLALADEADVILFAANATRANDFKDFPTLERAVRLLGEASRDRPLIFACVGEAGTAAQHGSAEVRMVGHLGTARALVPWYQAADLYVHAARADTFPTTVLEALACGLPVVATAVGGIPEQVDPGRTGELTPPGDARALAATVQRLLDQPQQRAQMASAARQDASARFDAERMVDAYEAWYRELRRARKRPAA